MTFWIKGFPLPPSINEQLASVNGRQIKTAKARTYDRIIMFHMERRKKQYEALRLALEPLLKDHVLRVDQYFCFHQPRVFTKSKGARDWVKVLDHMNFQKSSQDALAKAIGIDDKFFFSGQLEKLSCSNLSDEQILFRIEAVKPRTLADLEKEIAYELPDN